MLEMDIATASMLLKQAAVNGELTVGNDKGFSSVFAILGARNVAELPKCMGNRNLNQWISKLFSNLSNDRICNYYGLQYAHCLDLTIDWHKEDWIKLQACVLCEIIDNAVENARLTSEKNPQYGDLLHLALQVRTYLIDQQPVGDILTKCTDFHLQVQNIVDGKSEDYLDAYDIQQSYRGIQHAAWCLAMATTWACENSGNRAELLAKEMAITGHRNNMYFCSEQTALEEYAAQAVSHSWNQQMLEKTLQCFVKIHQQKTLC